MRKTELQRFRKLLNAEKERVTQSLAQHEKIIKHTDDQSGLEMGKAHSNHMADQGSDEFQYETTIKFANTEGRYLYNIEEALRRTIEYKADLSAEARVSQMMMAPINTAVKTASTITATSVQFQSLI